jgi:hypothetical protein
LIEIHAVQVEGGGSRGSDHRDEATAGYTQEFYFHNLLLESYSFYWFRR